MNKQDNGTASGDQTASDDQTARDDHRNDTESNPEFQEHTVHDATPPTSPTAPDTPDSSSDAVTDDQADTANTIPLYAAAPPLQAATEGSVAGDGQTGQDARQRNAYHPHGYAAAGYRDATGSGTPYAQPYVYVPPQGAQPEQLLRKTGPSAATIIFGALMLFAGVITLLLGLRFPNMILPQLRADPRVFVAVICAVAGLILVAVAVAWSLSKLIHNIRHQRRLEDGSIDRSTDAPDPAPYDASDQAAHDLPGMARDLHPSDETDQRTDADMDENAPTQQGSQTRAPGQTRAQ